MRGPAALSWDQADEIIAYPEFDWVVVVGESGPKARAMHLDWVRSIRDERQSAGVVFFFKQAIINGRTVSTPEIDGQRWVEYPCAR